MVDLGIGTLTARMLGCVQITNWALPRRAGGR